MGRSISAILLGAVAAGLMGCSPPADTTATVNETVLLNDEGGGSLDKATVSSDDPGANLFNDGAPNSQDAVGNAAGVNSF